MNNIILPKNGIVEMASNYSVGETTFRYERLLKQRE